MADLFEKDTDTISLHLENIFKDGELEEKATTEESSVVRQEGKRQVLSARSDFTTSMPLFQLVTESTRKKVLSSVVGKRYALAIISKNYRKFYYS